MMGLFDSIFDFNRDGKTDFEEKVVGTALGAMMFDDAMEADRRATTGHTPSYSARSSSAADDTAWREEYRFDMSDIDPDDYDTEEEYLEAVEASEWRSNYEYDCATGVDPADYDTEEEYLEELEYERDSLLDDDDEDGDGGSQLSVTLRVCPIGMTWEELDAKNEAVAARNQSLHARLVAEHIRQPEPDMEGLRLAIALYKLHLLTQDEPNFTDTFLVRRTSAETPGEGLKVILGGADKSVLIAWQDIPEDRRDILRECVNVPVSFRAIARPELVSEDGMLMCVEVYNA